MNWYGEKNKGISRIDSRATHGWLVRGYKNGKTFSKLFSDLKLGGKTKALDMATAYRDELHSKLENVPKKERTRRIVYRNSRNTTGVLGVCRTAKRSSSGRVWESFSVTWQPEPGVLRGTANAIRKYGEKKAFRLAVVHRRRMLLETYGPGILRKMAAKQREHESSAERG